MSDHTRRLAALAGFAALIVLAFAGLSLAASSWLQGGAELARLKEAAANPAPRLDPRRYVILATSRAEATSSLQTRINQTADITRVTRNRVGVRPVQNGAETVLVVDLEVSGQWDQLTRFLHALEAETPALAISELRAVADPGAPDRPVILTLTIEARFAAPGLETEAGA